LLSTAFDNESLKMLIRLGIRRIKIPSGEINNRQLLEFAGKQKLPIILSTGMSYLSEVMQAIKIITKSGTPKSRITVLHCTSEYPLPLKGVNLFAMKSIESNEIYRKKIKNAYKKLENSLCLSSSTHLNKSQLKEVVNLIKHFK